MIRKVIAVATIISMMAISFFAGRDAGIKHVVENGFFFTVDCKTETEEVTYDLYVELPDGEYTTTLYIC